MKTKKGFVLRNVCGENIIVAEGKENIDFTKIISMNETAAYLWKNVEGKDFDPDTLKNLLMKEYEVEELLPMLTQRLSQNSGLRLV